MAIRPSRGAGTIAAQPKRPARGPIEVGYVVDQSRHYPGETVTFFAQVTANQALPQGFMLRVSLPDGLEIGDLDSAETDTSLVPTLLFTDDSRYLTWQVRRQVAAGEKHSFEFQAEVAHSVAQNGNAFRINVPLSSTAAVLAPLADGSRASHNEVATVSVATKARYLRYLPALYEADPLMNRLLMLFESFIGPIEEQANDTSAYFDPYLTPDDMLPWLASWLNLALDENWPADRRRALVASGSELYRARGTKRGLERYLEIFTGVKPTITEHRARNMTLGKRARLGPGIALGKDNQPHTFSVTFQLPNLSNGKDKKERERLHATQEETIKQIIESEKPAHTAYTLRIERTDD